MKTKKPATQKTSGSPETAGTPVRRWFFAVALAIPVLFFLFLEGGLRLAGVRGNPDLFVPLRWQNKEYWRLNENFSKRYFYTLSSPPTPSNDIFLKQKPENGLRIFYLGESSAAGYPYGHNAMPSRMLADVLKDAYPDRHVEVVNMAMSAINSYTLYDMTSEILVHKPDAILIYTGHNEYYGALGVGSNESLGAWPAFVRAYLKLQNLRIFTAMRSLFVKLAVFTSNKEIDQSKTLMERVVREQIIPLESTTYKLGLIQFKSNMNALIKSYREAGVSVYFSTVASNLRDFAPFESVPGDSTTNAHKAFETAQSFLKTGNTKEAKNWFLRAKELDALRFRAPEAINLLIKGFCDESSVFLVDANKAIEEASMYGSPGNEWFLEHLHPTWEGNHLIAKTFAEILLKKGPLAKPDFVVDKSGWLEYKNRMCITRFDEIQSWHRLQVLYSGWPFRKKSVPRDQYMRNYKPVDVYDSIAVQTVHGRLLWGEAKLKLAQELAKRRRFLDAAREYEALHRDDPGNLTPVEPAARLYLDAGDFSSAFRMLSILNRSSPDYFNTKMLGITALALNNATVAVEKLEIARQQQPADTQVLYNLSGAYGIQKNFDKAKEILDLLKSLDPAFPGLREWEKELSTHLKRTS
jgi:tetratricopeptide (TPR) repeat protein